MFRCLGFRVRGLGFFGLGVLFLRAPPIYLTIFIVDYTTPKSKFKY